MLLFHHALVGDQERYVVIRNGRFEQILEPGEHILFGRGVEFERHDVRRVVFDSVWADPILDKHRAVAERHFVVVEPGRAELALVYFDGKAARIVGPGGRALYWRGPVAVAAELVRVSDGRGRLLGGRARHRARGAAA
jgi:hypothetical protein